MEYSGLIQRYKINRPLTDEEHALHLKQKQRLEIEPHYHLGTIKLNSTFLESVDKYYGWKGALTLVMSAVTALCVGVYGMAALVIFVDAPALVGDKRFEAITAGVFIAVLSFPLLFFTVLLLLKESFRYTHYPIHLNRKNRMVYVFRLNGTVLSVPWDGLFFTLGRGMSAPKWDVRGHVLDADGMTVRETFAFGMEWEVQSERHRHWEYFRRYMEEGPQTVIDLTPVYLPISDRRETWFFGLMRLIINMPGAPVAQLVMFPFSFLFSLGRWFAMHTSKIPAWPQAVEDACRIAPGDPFERDARHNPANFWKST